ncbi:MAG TPA: hypothetical protein VN109_07900 [Devosia sp.]|nr:hypothetical protein [Devosia sp.]
MYETIVHVSELAQARVLIAALKAHGFHPLEGGQNGLPGMPGVVEPRGIAIQVPDEEARDGKLLAEDLLKQMRAR